MSDTIFLSFLIVQLFFNTDFNSLCMHFGLDLVALMNFVIKIIKLKLAGSTIR